MSLCLTFVNLQLEVYKQVHIFVNVLAGGLAVVVGVLVEYVDELVGVNLFVVDFEQSPVLCIQTDAKK